MVSSHKCQSRDKTNTVKSCVGVLCIVFKKKFALTSVLDLCLLELGKCSDKQLFSTFIHGINKF